MGLRAWVQGLGSRLQRLGFRVQSQSSRQNVSAISVTMRVSMKFQSLSEAQCPRRDGQRLTMLGDRMEAAGTMMDGIKTAVARVRVSTTPGTHSNRTVRIRTGGINMMTVRVVRGVDKIAVVGVAAGVNKTTIVETVGVMMARTRVSITTGRAAGGIVLMTVSVEGMDMITEEGRAVAGLRVITDMDRGRIVAGLTGMPGMDMIMDKVRTSLGLKVVQSVQSGGECPVLFLVPRGTPKDQDQRWQQQHHVHHLNAGNHRGRHDVN